MSGEGGAIAEVLAAALWDEWRRWLDPTQPELAVDHLKPILADLLAAERQRGREEALREAAKEAEERGDIGKDGGCEAWTWLRIRADRIADVPASAEGERGC